MIYELDVYGFNCAIVYRVGETPSSGNMSILKSKVKKIEVGYDPNTGALGYTIIFEDNEKHYLEGNFQFVVKELIDKE